jgi:hypothetical protein
VLHKCEDGWVRGLPQGVKPWKNVWSAGHGIGLIHDIPSVAELVHGLQVEYVAACAVPDMAAAAKAATRLGEVTNNCPSAC